MAASRYWILSIFFLAGCVTSVADQMRAVQIKFSTIIYDDGVSLEEATVIAQQQLITENVVQMYELLKPRVQTDVSDLPRAENYWFIYFEEKGISQIPFIFMTVVDKKTGQVKFAQDYSPEKRWILEAALLR